MLTEKEKKRDVVIGIVTIILVVAVILFLKYLNGRYTSLKDPIFLNDEVVCRYEDDTLYIPFTYLDNLSESRYIKEIQVGLLTAEVDRSELSLGDAPRNYGGSAMFYKMEAYTKPYSFRKQVVALKLGGGLIAAGKATVTMSDGSTYEVEMDITFAESEDEISTHVNRDVMNELGISDELSEALFDKATYEDSDAGKCRFDKEAISEYVLKTQY